MNTQAKRNPNNAPKNTAVKICAGGERKLPPDSKKPAYAKAGIQMIRRNCKRMGALPLRAEGKSNTSADREFEVVADLQISPSPGITFSLAIALPGGRCELTG